MQTSERAAKKCIRVVALLVVAFSAASCSKGNFTPPIAFGRSAVATQTNANLLAVTITNESDFEVVCLSCPVEVSSNGVWTGAALVPKQKMTRLAPRQSGLLVIDAAATNASTRVPVMWGYSYPRKPTRMDSIRESWSGRITGRNPRGMGALYTNYLTNVIAIGE